MFFIENKAKYKVRTTLELKVFGKLIKQQLNFNEFLDKKSQLLINTSQLKSSFTFSNC